MRESKFFKTLDGAEILEISKKLMALRPTWHIYQVGGGQLAIMDGSMDGSMHGSAMCGGHGRRRGPAALCSIT